MTNLSERQQNIINFIIEFVDREKYPPTIREIGKNVGITSTSVVNYNLAKLEELNFIIRTKEKSRGLSLNWDQLRDHGLVNGLANGGFQDGAIAIPVLGHIAAGEPIQTIPSETTSASEHITITETMLSDGDARKSRELFALRVEGDSMIDASVMDGDYVIIHRQERAENGQMVAAWIDGDDETTLKHWYLEGDKVRLMPANKSYEPIIRDASVVRVQGRVVGMYRTFA